MSLAEWLKNGWLIKHETSRQEISHLLNLIDRDLKDCRNVTLSCDWRFNIAFNAALQCAKTALAASGFPSAKGSHHYRVIYSLEHTIGADKKTIHKLDAFRKKRNASEYNHAGTVSTAELEEMIAAARALRASVEEWMRSNHPRLMAEQS